MTNTQEATEEKDPILSVVIPAYNVRDFIEDAVKSALAQKFDDFEVIVVNDGSTDDTLELLEKIDDPRLRIITQTNGGLSAARNTGVKNARGEIIGFLDGDDIWFPDKAKEHMKIMQDDPQIGITYSYSAYMQEDGKFSGQLLVSKKKQPKLKDMILRNHVGNGSTPFVRKACFDQAGLFNEKLRSCEDYEMWVRILKKTQFTCQLITRPLTGYRVRSGSLSMDYSIFLKNAEMVMECFDDYLPNLSRRDKGLALGDIYRVSSRKALSNGQLDLAKGLMDEALKNSPSLLLRDFRAMGTFILINVQSVLPEFLRPYPYKMARGFMLLYYIFLSKPRSYFKNYAISHETSD